MKRSVLITYISHQYPEASQVVYNKYKAYVAKGFEHLMKFNPLFLPLEEDSPVVDEVIHFIRDNYHCDPCDVRGYYLYTKKDMDQAKFLQLKMPHPLELEGTSAKSYGTEYGHICPECGAKENVVGDVFVDRKFIKNKSFGTFDPEIYVSETVREIFEANYLTGITFGPEVLDYKRRDMPRHYVMRINSILPAISPTTWTAPFADMMEKKCRHNPISLKSDLQYEADKLEQAMDFNYTSEYFTRGSLRLVVISAKVRRVLIQNKIKAWYEPVLVLK